jgi:hypothetical protein
MTLLFFDGFEDSANTVKPEWSSAISNSSPGRAGLGQYGRITVSGTVTLTLPIASAKVFSGLAVMHDGSSGTTNSFIGFAGDAGATTHLTLNIDSTYHLTLRRGIANGTIIATSTQTMPASTWHHMQVEATISDTVGHVVVTVEGTEWINYTGDTKNAGTATTIDALKFQGGGAIARTMMDDLWVCNDVDATGTQGQAFNTYLGDLRVERLYPNGNGASNQFVGSDGNSTDNYLLVDETTVSTADYVGSATVGQQDLYEITNVSAAAATIYAVRVGATVSKSDAGAAAIKQLLRSGAGTLTAEATETLLTTWQAKSGVIRTKNPDGNLWTPTLVNSLQIGVEVA